MRGPLGGGSFGTGIAPPPPAPPLAFWDTGGYWPNLATSLVSATPTARVWTNTNGASVVNPAIGGNAALLFNGTTQRLNNTYFDQVIRSGRSFCVAAKLRTLSSAFQAFWSAAYGFAQDSIRGGMTSLNVPTLDSNAGGVTVSRVSDANLRFDTNTVVWTYDATTNTTVINVNGVNSVVSFGTTPIALTAPDPLTTFAIGCWELGPSLLFNGYWQSLAISTLLPTPAQIVGLNAVWQAADFTRPLAASPKFLWVGDSLTQGDASNHSGGFRYTLEQYIIAQRWSLYSVGQYFQGGMPNNRHGSLGGSDLAVIQANFPTALAGQRVELVSFMGGTNNMSANNVPAALAAYQSCLDAIWTQASAFNPNVKISVTTIPDEQIGTPGQTSIAPFNAGLPAIWASRSYASHLITFDAYAAIGPWAPGTYYVDSTHFNDAGADRYFNNAYLPAVGAYLDSVSPT